MPESSRNRKQPFVSSSVVLLALLLGVGSLCLLARTEHPGRFLLVAIRGGRFQEIGNGVLQTGPNDCGPAALVQCLRDLGEEVPYPDPDCGIVLTERGCRMDALAAEAARLGWDTRSRRLDPQRIGEVRPPAILHAREGHFLVFEGIRPDGSVELQDPAVGRITHTPESLARRWTGHVLEFTGRRVRTGTAPAGPARTVARAGSGAAPGGVGCADGA
jgi:predicted double-glycine peptidase